MERNFLSGCVGCVGVFVLAAFQVHADTGLTIYNQNFAVVRGTVPLDLKAGVNNVSYNDITAHLEPDSVILRDPAGKLSLRILEQNYRNDPVSQGLLLSLSEGKTIDFIVKETNKPDRIAQGKIIRSGYVAHSQTAMRRYGERYTMAQSARAYDSSGSNQPIIEVDGKILFSMPGQPVFPSLGDDTILKPSLAWSLESDKAAKLEAELCYITGGMSWEADYNVVAPENGDKGRHSWLGHDGQPERKDLRERQNKTHGWRCEQNPARGSRQRERI